MKYNDIEKVNYKYNYNLYNYKSCVVFYLYITIWNHLFLLRYCYVNKSCCFIIIPQVNMELGSWMENIVRIWFHFSMTEYDIDNDSVWLRLRPSTEAETSVIQMK